MEKVVRSLKNKDKNDAIDGYRIYYNFIRPHQALNGKTPAEVCGIEIKGKIKWRTLIRNASHRTMVKK